MGDRIKSGYHLEAGQYLESPNGKYTAIMQRDTNFCVYQKYEDDGNLIEPARPIYATGGTIGTLRFQLRNTGRLTLVNPSYPDSPEWNSLYDADGQNSFLVMQDDGDLVAYKVYNGKYVQDPKYLLLNQK